MDCKAYHRLRTADAHTIEGPVSVQCDHHGNITEWHRLTREEPFTIWIGGTQKVTATLDEMLSLERRQRKKQQKEHNT
ncbi:MAG TPA: hypothetical protein DC006_05230 [Prevotellaceae bacterium]|nr:hypothetical protein [Prevotellaceae bacterium]HBE55444.1 hypothetical protein [Prevotellaceae bacterium]